MFKRACKAAVLLVFLASCSPEPAIELSNTLDVARTDEPISCSRTLLESHFGSGPTGMFPFLKTESGAYIPMQFDDLNGDSIWDEMAFLVNLEASASMELLIEWLPAEKAPVFPKRTQVYLGQAQPDGSFKELHSALAPQGLDGFPTRYQAEGVCWENDKIAFRVYFDCRNAKDLFGKLKPELIAHQAGTPPFGSYHELSDWGMDILHCGSSLGAGGLALLEGDSLYRLGSTEQYHYQEIADGPVRSVFELRYQGWAVADQKLAATERITIWAGSYGFQSAVTASGFAGKKGLVTGIVTTRLDREPENYAANQDFTVLLTQGYQSLNNDFLAMAVLAPTDEILSIAHTGNTNYFERGDRLVPSKSFSQQITETYYLNQKISANEPVSHYFYAFWGLENPDWKALGAVKNALISEANRISAPVQIAFKTKNP